MKRTFYYFTLFIGLIFLSSCGSTVKALVQSPKDSATTTITITTNNPTQVSPETTTNPNISIPELKNNH